MTLQEYNAFVSHSPICNPKVTVRAQTTLDGHISVSQSSTAKPYPYAYSHTDSVQHRLVDDVLRCFAETMIPLRALEKKSFDRLVKNLDRRAVVSALNNLTCLSWQKFGNLFVIFW